MSQTQDEARAARIAKYKEERRIQLTARTATLFSSNVTERRPRKPFDRTPSEENPVHPKSSSELNLTTASTSVPIRSTRTSRLRAAAATHSDSSLVPRKSNRSSSEQSLLENERTKTSKLIDRDKVKLSMSRRHSRDKDLKTTSASISDKEIGANKTKSKHSTSKSTLEKGYKLTPTNVSNKNIDAKNKSKSGERSKKSSLPEELKYTETPKKSVSVDSEIIDDILFDKGLSDSLEKEKVEDLFNNLLDDQNLNNDIDIKISDEISLDNLERDGGLKIETLDIPNREVINNVNLEDSVVPKEEEKVGGLLGAVCVRKVERFSELLSNLCSPYEADLLFEDILADNGIGSSVIRTNGPECTPPCRRAQPSRTSATPKRTHGCISDTAVNDTSGTITKTRSRRSIEPSYPKTENSLPSSKTSPKNTFNLSFGIKSSIHKPTSKNTTPQKINERRKSSEGGKPSCIPLSKNIFDKRPRNSTSPIKQDLNKDSCSKVETKTSGSLRNKTVRKTSEKAKSDTENNRNDRKHRVQRESGDLNGKYHYSKKRLSSLDKNSSADTNNTKSASPSKNILNDKLVFDCKLEKSKHIVEMSTIHATVRPHATNSRFSQEMDTLAALTQQTLDRVNKLSNNSNKSNLDSSETQYDPLSLQSLGGNLNKHTYNYCLTNDKTVPLRGVTERLRDIDTAAQRLIDFEKHSAMFSDLNNDTSSQNRRLDMSSTCCSTLTPVSILKRKSIHEDNAFSNTSNNAIASPPVTFSPSVTELHNCRSENRQRQGILKKRRSLDESQVARRRSCSPEVSFADDGSSDTNKPILKNRRSSLEDVVRNRSPDGQIQGILKRKMSKEEDHVNDDLSYGSPEPHGILKRKSNSSSSSSTASSHVSIAQAVLLAAAGGAEIVEDDKEAVRPILKKKSFSEERPAAVILVSDTPKPILKKKSMDHDDHDFDLPMKPILKTSKKLSGDEGHASSFDLSEEDRSSRRPSLLRSRTSDHSGSECEATVRPILKQRGSSLTRERSQSPRPRLSFCADNDTNSLTNFSCDANDLPAAGPRRVLNLASNPEEKLLYPSAVIRRRNLRPKSNPRSKSLACDVNDELLSILNNRRLKVDENCENGHFEYWDIENKEKNDKPKAFPSIASRIKSMEQALTKELVPKDQPSTSKPKIRDRDRYKTQPITIEEMRSITSSLEPSQTNFQAFSPVDCSFPTRLVESSAAPLTRGPSAGQPERDPFADLAKILDSPPFGINSFSAKTPDAFNGLSDVACAKEDSYGEATFLDYENIGGKSERKNSTLDEIEQEVNKVRVALDEESRALEEDERLQAEVDNWSLNVSCDSGVYNRASSRDSGPHSGEELGLIESQEIKENQETNSCSNDWSSLSVEQDLINMNRERKSTETDPSRYPEDQGSDDEKEDCTGGFALGLVKSNSVVARASMWQQLQQQAKGNPKPLLRHTSRSKAKDGPSVADRFKTQPISFTPTIAAEEEPAKPFSLTQSKSTANVLDRDEEAKLDEDDPAKMSLGEKMKMFNSKLTHKPPVAGLPRPKEERLPRASRLKTMPVLASQVQEAMEQNERLTKSLTNENVPRNPDFQLKMELFRSASAKNTSLEYLMRENAKFRSLDLDDDDSPTERAQRMITPEVRGILKSGTTVVPSKTKVLAKGESSEGLKDEGIDSSSDDESSASSVSSSEKSCSSSDSSDELPGPKHRRFQRKNKLKSSRTDSDLPKVLQESKKVLPPVGKIQLPGANELKERFNQAKNPDVKIPLLGKLGRKPSQEKNDEDDRTKYRRFAKKLEEPIQLGKLRRPTEKPAQPVEIMPEPVLKISALNQEAKNKFFGLEPKKEKSIDELTAAVRRFIPPVSKSMSIHAIEAGASGSDGESSGGREVRHINTRGRNRLGGGVQRSATHAEMPHRGGTIAERLAALQAAGANDWRARVCRHSPEKEDTKALERAKNKINDSLNAVVDDKKKVAIDDNELGPNILADRRNKLETAAQGWRKRVPQTDASLFTVAGRLERDKVTTTTPPQTPPPVPAPTTPSSPGVPSANKFKSRRQHSPTNGFASGPLRSASCAVVSAPEVKPKEPTRTDRESFKRSHSVSESISRVDDKDECSPGAEKSGCTVRVPRADDETFQAFFTPVLNQDKEKPLVGDVEVDLDAIDSGSRQLLASEWARRAKRERRHAASRNPLRALAARTDLREEYSPPPPAARELFIKDKVKCGLAAEALAALASTEDFSNVALRSAAAPVVPSHGIKPLMMLHVKGRRRVQTRLVEPVHTSVNRGDCFVLVTPDQVFLYQGLYANVIERSRSADIALHIHNTKDLGCKNSTAVLKLDEQSHNISNKHWNQFWSLLGVTDDIEEYKPIEAGHPDEDEIYESCIVQTNMCYEVIDDELIPMQEYWGQMPKIEMLHQSKTIVFDYGSEMYIWYGKNVPLEIKRKTAQLAQELFDVGYNYEECHINPLTAAAYQGARETSNGSEKTAKSRPEWSIFSKVTQHMETILFKEKFLDWPDYTRVIQVKPQENKSNGVEIAPCDAEEMFSNEYEDPDLILEGSHIGRGTHYYDKESMRQFEIKSKSLCKWVVREYDYQKVDNDADIGEFFSGDSYIIRWEYQITVSGRELNGKPSKHNVTGRDRCAYFCWQGRDASSNEKGAAALLTVELDKEKGPQVRVAQGNEPSAFLNLFQGNLVIHQGKKGTDRSKYKLFVTRGNVSNEAYLVQVPCSVRQLRSRGSLLLVDTEKGALYIWHGSRSLKHTKNVAIDLANRLIARKSTYLFGDNASDLKIMEVKEGEESKEVLEALGVTNKQYYNSVLGGKEGGGDVTPRLFHLTDAGGQFEANEVLSPLRHEHLVTPFPFEQKELYAASQPALFLLDAGGRVWVWQGWWATEEEEAEAGAGARGARWQALRAAALRTADAYWRVSRGQPEGDADVALVVAGLEPADFTDLFDTWTDHDQAAEANIAHGYKSGEVVSGACELSRLSSVAVLPLAALQRRPLPDHLDSHHLERHLSHADFLTAFGMTKEKFEELPAWKQTNMKKEVGLF